MLGHLYCMVSRTSTLPTATSIPRVQRRNHEAGANYNITLLDSNESVPHLCCVVTVA